MHKPTRFGPLRWKWNITAVFLSSPELCCCPSLLGGDYGLPHSGGMWVKKSRVSNKCQPIHLDKLTSAIGTKAESPPRLPEYWLETRLLLYRAWRLLFPPKSTHIPKLKNLRVQVISLKKSYIRVTPWYFIQYIIIKDNACIVVCFVIVFTIWHIYSC